MKTVDLVIKNARMLLEGGVIAGGVGVLDGRICAIARDEHLPDADREIDVNKKLLMPGLIDGHAHFHDLAMLDHEDFTTGSRAAAAGGVTTFVDMPLTSNVIRPADVNEKIEQGEKMSVIDFALYGGMIDAENYLMIHELSSMGIDGFKAFTSDPFYANAGVIARALSEISEVGGHLTIHSEDQGILTEFAKDMEGDWDAPVSHSLSRPNVAESVAIGQNIEIAKLTGGHLHIAHLTTAEGVDRIAEAKGEGVTVTTEVCPHHLTFTRDDMNRLGPESKMNPPLRSSHDRGALWSALLRGTIDMTVSDHAPAPMEKKMRGKDDIREAWAGVDGTQMILRILLSEGIGRGRLSFDRLLHVACRNPAKIFGLYPKKGTIAIGSDADLVVVDRNVEQTITADMMFSKCGWTLYEGMKMQGAPIMTFVRGTQVFGENRIMVKPGHGEFQPMGGIRTNRGK
ncbi:allantoinase AllB [Candidatus Thorarchaeota archaeon]|nr:MAG: allantoinase AllB [Candidatus Thorarchaeota archaeon]